MFAACADRTSRTGRGGCAPRNPCTSFWTRLFAPRARLRPRRPDSPATGFRGEVERYVEPLLPSGAIRMEAVARALNFSRQTLYRRLKAEGVTFERLLDALRRRLALRLVREPGLSVKEIAYRLGFSEPAAFSRAFKRWTGRTPRQARGRQSG